MPKRTLTRQQALDRLIEDHLMPNSLWFVTLFDRKQESFCLTGNRYHILLDEPNWRFEPEHERLLSRWEAEDPDLVVVPRMPDSQRQELVEQFASSAPGNVRDSLLALKETINEDWRPYSFLELVSDIGEIDVQAWSDLIRRAAHENLVAWMQAHGISLEATTELIFESL
jgi:hypothetical protein